MLGAADPEADTLALAALMGRTSGGAGQVRERAVMGTGGGGGEMGRKVDVPHATFVCALLPALFGTLQYLCMCQFGPAPAPVSNGMTRCMVAPRCMLQAYAHVEPPALTLMGRLENSPVLCAYGLVR